MYPGKGSPFSYIFPIYKSTGKASNGKVADEYIN